MVKHTSLRARFLGFAGGHFMLSALAVVVAFAALSGREHWIAAVTAVLMLLYLPAGILAARLLEWERPTLREWLRAVALVGGIACLWGFGGFALCFAVPLVGFCLLMSTAFLATPSFCLMFSVAMSSIDLPGLSWMPTWYVATALAALLPPVLFFAGALLTARHPSQAGPDEGRGTP